MLLKKDLLLRIHISSKYDISFDMCRNPDCQFFLLKNDVFRLLKEKRTHLFLGFTVLLIGVIFGVVIAIKIGEKDTPFGVFASLFDQNYSPFSYLVPDLLRFVLFALLCSLCFFLPIPLLYPTFALLFFGKYFGQLSAVVWLSDPIFPALLSILLIYLPLVFLGGFLLIYLAFTGSEYRLAIGGDPCPITIKRGLITILLSVFAYFALLFFLYVVLCGLLYLLTIAL